jgi:hypothetical protein
LYTSKGSSQMNSIRVTTLAVLVLATNITTPMLHLPESINSVAERNKFDVLDLENKINLGVLTMQATLFALLKSENILFGTELIPTHKKETLVLSTLLGTFAVTMSVLFNALSSDCTIHSSLNSGISILLTVSTMGHMSNLIYNDALKLIKKNFRPKLIIKNTVDLATLDDAKCVICYDDERDKKYVNPCEQAGHIFCKDCLMRCFAMHKEEPSFVGKKSFWCELCRKEAPFNDEKFEVERLAEPQVTFGLWAKQVGSMAIFYAVQFFLLVSVLQHHFS